MPSLAPITQSPGLPASQGEAGTASPVRRFGRFQLLALVGKSQRTMLWEVDDPRVGQELLLALPRQRPADSSEADLWHQNARRAARLDHPSLAHVVEVGEHDRWPFIAYDRGGAATLDERLTPFVNFFTPVLAGEEIERIVHYIEEALLLRESLSLEDVAQTAAATEEHARKAFERLARTGKYEVQDIERVGMVIVTAQNH